MPTVKYAHLFLACALLLGCGLRSSPPTLVDHVHDGVYDFVDHFGIIVETASSLDELDAIARKPQIQALIHNHHIVVRFVGEKLASGWSVPDEVNAAMAYLVLSGGTTSQDSSTLTASSVFGAG